MRVAEGGERSRWAPEIKGALCLERRHEHGLVGRQNLGRFAHETNARDDQRRGRVVSTKARHLERIRDEATRGFCKFLNVTISVVMRDQRCVSCTE